MSEITVNPSGGTAIPSSQLTSALLGTASGLTAYAQGRISVVDGFIQNLAGLVLSLQAPPITPNFPIGAAAPAIEVPEPPVFATTVWQAPGFPTAFTETLEVGDLDVQPFDIDPPTLNYGTAPPAFEGVLPDAPAVNFSFDDPTLTVNLPSVPNLLTLDVQKFDGLNLPTFDATDPVLVAIEPSVREWTPGSQYTSSLLEGLKATLEDRITNGGTGLTQEVENAIWDRGREREARTQSEAIEKLDQMESLGYALPPGIYLDARTKIITESDFASRGLSREVMIKSAELMLDNVKHALTTSVQLESRLIDYTNQVEQRIFESTKYATEAGISIYNAKVQAFAAMVDAYKGKVAVYEAQVRAEVSKVDAYRATIAAEEAKATINRALVDQYKVQVDVALSNIEIYKAEIAGIQTKAEIEKTKVEIFGEQVRAFTARVNAYTAGVEGFRATVQAEATKSEAYKSQVEAFSARVQATASIIDARVKAFEGKIAGKTAEYDGYKAAVAGESSRVDAIAKTAGVQADAYKSRITAVGAYNEVLVKEWAATIDQQARIAEIGVSAAKANAELYITTRSLSLDAAKTGATVAAQIGAAALNAVNFSGSVSSSESASANVSAGASFSQSKSESDSHSTNYNYNASV
jgi:ribosomal protein L31E